MIDANAIVSALTAVQGTMLELRERWDREEFDVVLSKHIVDEVTRAWTNAYWQTKLGPDEVADLLARLSDSASTVDVPVVVAAAATHPEDDVVVATAVATAADVLITGHYGRSAVAQAPPLPGHRHPQAESVPGSLGRRAADLDRRTPRWRRSRSRGTGSTGSGSRGT